MADRDLLLVELHELGAEPERYLEMARQRGSTLVVTLDGKPQITVDGPESLAIVEEALAASPRGEAPVTSIGVAEGAVGRRLDLSA